MIAIEWYIAIALIATLTTVSVSQWWFSNADDIRKQSKIIKRRHNFNADPYERYALLSTIYNLLHKLKVNDKAVVKKTQNSAPAGTQSAYKSSRRHCVKK